MFASSFVGLIGYTTYLCGVLTLLRLLFVPALVVVHATPLVPIWSFRSRKFNFVKLKDVLGAFKSSFGAVCIGLMDTKVVAQHVCAAHPSSCGSEVSSMRQARALAYTILYDFLLETIFDLRDIDEDVRNGVKTLPVALGRERTLLLLAAVVNLGDLIITGVRLDLWTAAECVFRSTLSWALFAYTASNRPRSDTAAWGLVTLIGLVPAWWAQVRLL